MSNNNSILIFHRSKNNSEEDLINQQTFLSSHPSIAGSTKIIDYISGANDRVQETFDLTKSPIDRALKMKVIVHSFLSKNEYARQYDLYPYLQFFKAIDIASFYLMDSEGRLYKEVTNLDKDI